MAQTFSYPRVSGNEIQNLFFAKYNVRNGCFDKLYSFSRIPWNEKVVVYSNSKMQILQISKSPRKWTRKTKNYLE